LLDFPLSFNLFHQQLKRDSSFRQRFLLEFAESLPAGEVSAPVARLTDLYLVARFGNHGASSAADTDDRWEIPLADRNADAQRFVALLATI
jgi:hypothetical protein